MEHLVSGAVFGAALTASGVYQPSVILSQLKFTNFHMLQAFLAGAAGSTAIVTAAQKLGYVQLKPRHFSTVGLFAPWDGNVIGGILLGTGMSLAGACPGTVLAQMGNGIRSGFYAFEGATIAGIVWTGILAPLIHRAQPSESPTPKPTVYENFGISRTTAVVAFEMMCVAIITACSFTAVGPEAKLPPVVGGLCIAAAQLTSVLLRRNLMGTSTALEEIGDWFWGFFKGKVSPQRYINTVFCAGMVGGAWLLSKTNPAFAPVTNVTIDPLTAGIGGFLMILGSRMAGGCTSGHGISGLSLLSTSSFITIGTAFAWGGIFGMLFG
ncbi:hypothetical protein QBC34DRAFT_79880 [Podospora aff. communis PSN243]|uniref:Sulphur transport domain-containing protein n=1 Tax=Podospora aff. communis PSN243 TaxID=3040156 RepID=A0AAV9GPM8_9PEZI|nr:hypothetical protein QBC34DRAFT_79880 [Podospora aff. communis PSN243]